MSPTPSNIITVPCICHPLLRSRRRRVQMFHLGALVARTALPNCLWQPSDTGTSDRINPAPIRLLHSLRSLQGVELTVRARMYLSHQRTRVHILSVTLF